MKRARLDCTAEQLDAMLAEVAAGYARDRGASLLDTLE